MKEKLLTIMLSLFCLTVAGQNDQNTYKLRGDVNGDGIVNQTDVDIVANYIMGTPSDFCFEDVDVNNDGYANAADIVKIVEVINSGNIVVKYMFVWKSDGSRVTYDLDDTEGITFNENGIVVRSNAIDDLYSNNVSKITYGSSDDVSPITVGSPTQEAVYIYRSDGGFNAFFHSDIKRISFSRLGIDGNNYSKSVVQEVTTEDSLYRIPFSAIDSISFEEPARIYANKVRIIDDLIPYIIEAEDLSLTLSNNTPVNLIPQIGDVLLCEHFDKDLLPYGFAGRLIQIIDGTLFCESVTLDDVYERLIGIRNVSFSDAKQSDSPKTRAVSSGTEDAVKIELSLGEDENDVHLSLNGFMTCKTRVVYRHERNKCHYFSATLSPKIGVAAELGINGKHEKYWVSPKVDLLYLPIPSSPFLIYLAAGPTLKTYLEANFTEKAELSWGCEMGFSYENGSWHKFYKNDPKEGIPFEVTGDIDGRIFAGIETDLGICSIGKILSGVTETEVGLEAVANLSADLLNSGLYENLLDADIKANFIGNLGVKGEFNFAEILKLEHKWDIASLEWNINSWKLVPTFNNLTVAAGNNGSYVVSVDPSEKVLWKMPIGLGLFNNNVLQEYSYCTDEYKDIDSWPLEKYQTTFTNLDPSKEYTVAPMVKFLGKDVKASPEVKLFQPIKYITGNATNIKKQSATLNGTVENYDETDENIKFAFIYSTSEDILNSADSRSVMATYDGHGNMTANISGLADQTTYYYALAIKRGDENYVFTNCKSFVSVSDFTITPLFGTGGRLYFTDQDNKYYWCEESGRPTGNIVEGTTIKLMINTDPLYKLKTVVVDNQDVTAVFNTNGFYELVDINDSHIVNVEFEKKPIENITVNYNGDGAYVSFYDQTNNSYFAEPNQATELPLNDNIYIRVYTKMGYKLKSIAVDGQDVTETYQTEGKYIFGNLTESHVVDIQFDTEPVSTIKLVCGDYIYIQSYDSDCYDCMSYPGMPYVFKRRQGVKTDIDFHVAAGYDFQSIYLNDEDLTTEFIAHNPNNLFNSHYNFTWTEEIYNLVFILQGENIGKHTVSVNHGYSIQASLNGKVVANGTSKEYFEGSYVRLRLKSSSGEEYVPTSVLMDGKDVTSEYNAKGYLDIDDLISDVMIEVDTTQ